jgi:hypothetical protein
LRLFGTFLAVLVGLPIIRYAYTTSWRPGLSTGEWLIFIGMLVVTVHAVIATHELGHLIGGRMVGFRFRLLVMGPLRITADDGRVRIRLNSRLLDYAGVAASAPDVRADDTPRYRRRVAIVHAAGPVLSLLAGSVALAVLLTDVPDSVFRRRFAEFVAFRMVALFAAGSLAVGLITLMPGGTRNRPTDGSRILRLLGGSADGNPPPSNDGADGTATGGGGTNNAADSAAAGSTQEDA